MTRSWVLKKRGIEDGSGSGVCTVAEFGVGSDSAGYELKLC
jgi:hypothetical protein